jgi:hypothetical protein
MRGGAVKFEAAGLLRGLRSTVGPAGGSDLSLLRLREVWAAPNGALHLTASSLPSCLAAASGSVRLSVRLLSKLKRRADI